MEDLNRGRYYASATTLLSGQIYIQGGNGGSGPPEIRDPNGAFHLLYGVDTSDLIARYPRNFVAPDGRIFGYDSNGKMYFVDTDGNGTLTRSGTITGPLGTDSSTAMFRPGRILQFGGRSNGARVIDITGACAGRNGHTVLVVPTQACPRDDPCRRQGPRNRRQRSQE